MRGAFRRKGVHLFSEKRRPGIQAILIFQVCVGLCVSAANYSLGFTAYHVPRTTPGAGKPRTQNRFMAESPLVDELARKICKDLEIPFVR
jgi:hypothetical protein